VSDEEEGVTDDEETEPIGLVSSSPMGEGDKEEGVTDDEE